ncbi:SPOR domain-containing protein [Congregibacter litoralis]|uniref:Sporulation related protein domain protein n=1 Tax=Congregibacter litoralis KT71 TaxID=314285 RepID=A4A986_9GAMM|nr:SPOR domain-containing protein [Congregibacter litoralis]EAQ97628.1 Sporulation related protein domain protein [Congregibacter litoralis KT71]
MAREDEDPEIGASAGENSPSFTADDDIGRDSDPGTKDEDYRDFFVDRDDDSDPGFVDRDDDSAIPGADDDYQNVDPGYAAFASELDDPLADWPAPEVPLSELPEVRQQNDTPDDSFPSDSPVSVGTPETMGIPDTVSAEELPGSSLDDEELLFDDSGEESSDSNSPDLSDSDHLSAADEQDDPLADVEDYGVPEPIPEEDPEPVTTDEAALKRSSEASDYPELGVFTDDEDDHIDDPFAEAEVEESMASSDGGKSEEDMGQREAFSEDQENFEEEFVDDFLNDLDPPEDEELPAVEDYEEDLDPPLATLSPAAASSVEKAAPFETESMSKAEDEDPVVARPPVTAASMEEGRTFPLGMIAVVVVALLLLAVGGFGVMQQRSDMQAEIRDLQAKLATTVSPEEAEMERERQRQVQLQNESLSTELEALTAENDALAERLAELEALEAAQTRAAAEKRAQEEAAAEAAAQRRAAEAAAAARASKAPTTAAQSTVAAVKGPWFVNFGSYADRNIADRWANKLSVESGEVTVQTATAAGKTLYRVRVIGLADQDSAERVATALERQYQLPRLWVGKN